MRPPANASISSSYLKGFLCLILFSASLYGLFWIWQRPYRPDSQERLLEAEVRQIIGPGPEMPSHLTKSERLGWYREQLGYFKLQEDQRIVAEIERFARMLEDLRTPSPDQPDRTGRRYIQGNPGLEPPQGLTPSELLAWHQAALGYERKQYEAQKLENDELKAKIVDLEARIAAAQSSADNSGSTADWFNGFGTLACALGGLISAHGTWISVQPLLRRNRQTGC